jgi:hypothetical protein
MITDFTIVVPYCLRRLMESLIIEVFIHNQSTDEIKVDGKFVALDSLIGKICSRQSFHPVAECFTDDADIKQTGRYSCS